MFKKIEGFNKFPPLGPSYVSPRDLYLLHFCGTVWGASSYHILKGHDGKEKHLKSFQSLRPSPKYDLVIATVYLLPLCTLSFSLHINTPGPEYDHPQFKSEKVKALKGYLTGPKTYE